MTRFFLVLSMGALASCGTTASATRASRAQATADDMEIKQLIQKYEQALNASDADAVLALYGSEPVFMPQHAPAMVGREAVRKAYDQVFASIRLAIRFEVFEVQVLGDQAWARTSSAGRTTVLANGQVLDEGNNELFVFRREGGEWRIHRYLFATNRPPRP
jgi:uncharacterized protein (TIGR02246 family)